MYQPAPIKMSSVTEFILLNSFRYEPIYINLSAKPKWYLELFPAGKVPAVLYKGELLSESLLLADFLNDEFAENPLHSTEPIKKFKDRLIIENFGKVCSFSNILIHNNLLVTIYNPIIFTFLGYHSLLQISNGRI